MKFLLAVLTTLLLLGCTKSESTISPEALEKEIVRITEQNLATRTLADGWYYMATDSNAFKRVRDGIIYYVNPEPIVLPINFSSGEHFTNDEGDEGIAIFFDASGTAKWAEATKRATGSYLIFILNDRILTAPKVNTTIENGASALWKEDMSEAELEKINHLLKNFVQGGAR